MKDTLMKAHRFFYPSSPQAHLWRILLLGFTSGVPFLLTLSTLSFWLTESGIDKTTIGLFMLVSLPYSLKFFWAPLIDRFSIPFLSKKLGQRRGWALFSQIALMISIVNLGSCDPSKSIMTMVISAFCVSFFSATQDIVYDAYRIEIIKGKNRGTAAALESVGFRLGMLISGAGALYLASLLSWKMAYYLMVLPLLVGVCTVLTMPEPEPQIGSSLKKKGSGWFFAVLEPWHQFTNKNIFPFLLLFILCFKLADAVMNAMSAPFLHDLGFSKTEFADITKVFGIMMMVGGGFLGGIAINRWGILNSILLCSFLQAFSCLMFSLQGAVGYHYPLLVGVIGIESLCSGLTSTLFIAYVSSFCSVPYTATHFTLLYACGSLARVLTSTLSGWAADHCSWSMLFSLCALFSIPAILLVLVIERRRSPLPSFQHSSLQTP